MPSLTSVLVSFCLVATLSLSDAKSLTALLLEGDTSGEEPRAKLHFIAHHLQNEVDKLRKQFDENNTEVEIMPSEVQSSAMKEVDGCFKANFNKARCLRRISSGLEQFKGQMFFVKEALHLHVVDVIIDRTGRLLDSVHEVMGIKQEAISSVDVVPPGTSQWAKVKVVKGILRAFNTFLIDTHRGLRYMERLDEKRLLPQETSALN